MTKKYILTIEYNTKTDEIEYIQEELEDNIPVFEYGDIILNDYFDEETLEMMEDMYEIGVS
jgi:hypothetical protein